MKTMSTVEGPGATLCTSAAPASRDWPRPAAAWTVVFLLSVAYCLSFIDRYLLTLLVEPIKADLGLSDTQIGLLSGLAFGLFYALMGLPMGLLADRRSRRKIVAGGVFLWSAMTALCGFANNFWLLFVGRMGLGVGEAALTPAGLSLIADYFPPERRGRAISVFMTGASIGAGLAIMVGGAVVGLTSAVEQYSFPLIGTLRSWQLAFLLVGVPGMVLSVFLLLIREPVRRGVGKYRSGVASDAVIPYLKKRKWLLILQIAGMSLCAICAYGYTTWTPSFLIRVHGWTPERVGLVFGPIVMATSVAGMLFGGFWSDRMLKKGDLAAPIKVAAFGLLGLAIVAPIATQFDDIEVTLVLLGLEKFAVAIPYGVSLTALMGVAPNQVRGQVSAIYMFWTSVAGFGIGPTLVGYLSDVYFMGEDGLRHALSVLGFVTAPLACLLLFLAVRFYRGAVEGEMADGAATVGSDGES